LSPQDARGNIPALHSLTRSAAVQRIILTTNRRIELATMETHMKLLVYPAILAILAATPVFGADSVSLVGTWTGQRDRIAKTEGRRGGLATLTITEQQGNTGRSHALERTDPIKLTAIGP
jgi:hypothetical protein